MKYAALLTLIAAFLLVACGGSQNGETPTGEPQDSLLPDDPDVAPPAPTPLPPGYPAAPTVASGYPAPPVPIATPDPYPGGMLIMIRPVGEQCAETPFYESAEEAVDELKAEGIEVLEFEEIDLIVCAACGCPTSEHIRVALDPGDLAKAESLGWRRE